MIDDRQHARIKGALALRGLTLSSIARDLGVAPGTVSIVSRGFRRSRRIESAIAVALGCSPADLWPERYSTLHSEGGAK
ncbi:helix-turn-helix domain-containing protein [Sphingomonas kyeonggiensis]|uniref:helix-turn-helix domain-containing protein n=1 Tax=Sphingomonas kyeonggiensis TaxID=1268553 RepID=UPI00161391DB